MSEFKGTPGPWKAAYSERRENYQIWSKNGHWVANTKCESVPSDHNANAYLLASAPELLEALIHVSATLSWNAHGDCRSFHNGAIASTSDAIKMVKSAIAKALGEAK